MSCLLEGPLSVVIKANTSNMGIQYLSLRTVRVKRWFISVFVYVPGRQQKAFLQEKLKSRESRGQNHEGATLQSLPLSSWQQDEAEGAWAQAVVELPYLPAPAPGCYLWVVQVQHLESKPGVDTQSEYPPVTFGGTATFLLRLPGKDLYKSSVWSQSLYCRVPCPLQHPQTSKSV